METFDTKSLPPNFKRYGIIIGAVLLIAIGLYTSYVQIEPSETGVRLLFGAYQGSLGPGPHFILPFGIESVRKVNTEKLFTIKFTSEENQQAFSSRTEAQRTTADDYQNLVLSGDLNLALVNWTVIYKIENAKDYLFNVKNPDDTLAALAESVMRMVMGNESFNDVLKDRPRLQELLREELQELAHIYTLGIDVTTVQLTRIIPPKEVEDAYMERNRARQEAEKLVNEAQKELQYGVEKVEGEKERRHFEALGEKERAIAKSKGELEKYRRMWEITKAPNSPAVRKRLEALRVELEEDELTEEEIETRLNEEKAKYATHNAATFNKQQRERLYLEIMGEIYDSVQTKIFVSDDNMVPLFNMGDLQRTLGNMGNTTRPNQNLKTNASHTSNQGGNQ